MASCTCEIREMSGREREDGRKEMGGRREREVSGEVRRWSCCCCSPAIGARWSSGARRRRDRGSSPPSRPETLGVVQRPSPSSAFVYSPYVPYPLSHLSSFPNLLGSLHLRHPLLHLFLTHKTIDYDAWIDTMDKDQGHQRARRQRKRPTVVPTMAIRI